MNSDTCYLWRVELPTGEGPFVSDANLGLFFDKYRDESRFPAPRTDPLLSIYPHTGESVACVSKQQLNYWFGDGAVIRHLLPHHAQVVKLEVPEKYVTVGQYQALYFRKHARVIATFPLNILKTARNFKGKPKSKRIVEYWRGT